MKKPERYAETCPTVVQNVGAGGSWTMESLEAGEGDPGTPGRGETGLFDEGGGIVVTTGFDSAPSLTKRLG